MLCLYLTPAAEKPKSKISPWNTERMKLTFSHQPVYQSRLLPHLNESSRVFKFTAWSRETVREQKLSVWGFLPVRLLRQDHYTTNRAGACKTPVTETAFQSWVCTCVSEFFDFTSERETKLNVETLKSDKALKTYFRPTVTVRHDEQRVTCACKLPDSAHTLTLWELEHRYLSRVRRVCFGSV